MNTWFTSDWHLGHKNILEYDNREFESIGKHDIHLVNMYNSLVKDEDDVYFIGDFSLASKSITEFYMSQLRGNKFFTKGNHDKSDTIKLYEKYGTYLGREVKIDIGGVDIILNHFAMRVWENSHHGSLHLYGHSHDSLERFPWGRSMDIGIMSAKRILGKYIPFNFYEDILPILLKREIKIVDHHNERP